MNRRRFAAAIWLAGLLARPGTPPAAAGDWPQFRGPNHNGTTAETLAAWPKGGPKVLWKANVGTGYAGVSVSGGQLFTMGHAKEPAPGGEKRDIDQVWCLDAATGTTVWRHSYPCPRGSYYGPYTTPAVDAGLVISLSQFGQLHCFQKATGKVVWRKSLVDDFQGVKPYYGYACSPLIVGDVAVFEAGGKQASLVGLSKRTGQLVWKYGAGPTGYSSPVSARLNGADSVVALTPRAVCAVEAATGREVWRHAWKASPQSSATAPLVAGRYVFVSASETKQTGLLLEQAGRTVKVVWQNRNMLNYFNTSVLRDGHLYGVHSLDHIPKNSSLRCVDLLTAKVKWDQPGVGLGGLILAGNMLLVLTDKGDLVLVEAKPAAYSELGRAKVLDGKCWNAPVLSGGRIYCRNHRGDIVCLTLRADR